MDGVRFYLASASPRRLEITEKIGLEVSVIVADADEAADVTEPAALVEELSARKAEAVFEGDRIDRISQPFCVIGADTVVSLDGRILGKPADEEEAFGMLSGLSGRTHHVYTGVTVIFGTPDGEKREVTFHERTEVLFCEMSEEEIRAYIATGDPMDKAGAYGVQSYAAPFVKAINGDYYNVMGLPASRLYHELKEMGICMIKK